MLDHVVLNVADAEASKEFFTTALAPLGIEVLSDHPGFCGMGREGMAFFWLAQREPVSQGTHVAFSAIDRSTVDAFFEEAIAAGGSDNGPPGIRDAYHPHYYGAFVLDPDGNNIEAVCHAPHD